MSEHYPPPPPYVKYLQPLPKTLIMAEPQVIDRSSLGSRARAGLMRDEFKDKCDRQVDVLESSERRRRVRSGEQSEAQANEEARRKGPKSKVLVRARRKLMVCFSRLI